MKAFRAYRIIEGAILTFALSACAAPAAKTGSAPATAPKPSAASVSKPAAVEAVAPASAPAPETEKAGAREVTFSGRGLTLKGTLHVPPSEGPVAAIVLVHGSGPQSRDQTMRGQLGMGFRTPIAVFAALAERLTAEGYAVLRYDKRTCGPFNRCANNGYPAPPADLKADAFVDDAVAAVDWLASQPSVDRSRIVVLGHSQGAMFVPKIMAKRPTVAAGVMVAGSFRPLDRLVAYQLGFVEKLLAGKQNADAMLGGLRQMVKQLEDLRAARHDGSAIGGAPATFWTSLFALTDDAVTSARSLKRPLLVIGGGYDWNVPREETEAWKAALEKAPANPKHEVALIPCVTHALNCITEPDYRAIKPADIGRTVHPPLVERIVGFVGRHLQR